MVEAAELRPGDEPEATKHLVNKQSQAEKCSLVGTKELSEVDLLQVVYQWMLFSCAGESAGEGGHAQISIKFLHIFLKCNMAVQMI